METELLDYTDWAGEGEDASKRVSQREEAGKEPLALEMAPPDAMEEAFLTMIDELTAAGNRIYVRAQEELDVYMTRWRLANKQAQERNEKQGAMQFFVRRHKGSVEIAWKAHTGRKTKDKRRITEHVQKGRGHRYLMPTLRKHCKEWEWPLVWETEQRLAVLRQCYAQVGKARLQIRRTLESYREVRRIGANHGN